jgi:hypothetical protein
MKNQFVTYTTEEINCDNVMNILTEMMARCLSDGNRIIIEQGGKDGEKYIMVDFSPSDNSNNECEYDGQHVCYISSVDFDNEGKYYNQHTNYFEALEEIGSIIINDGFTKMYVETY